MCSLLTYLRQKIIRTLVQNAYGQIRITNAPRILLTLLAQLTHCFLYIGIDANFALRSCRPRARQPIFGGVSYFPMPHGQMVEGMAEGGTRMETAETFNIIGTP